MAGVSGRKGKSRSDKDKIMAARLKALGITRRTQICPTCYRVVGVENPATGARYTHICRG